MVVPRTRTQLGRQIFHVAAPVVWFECRPCLPPFNFHHLRTIQSWVENSSLQPSGAYDILWSHFVLRVYCTYLLTYFLTSFHGIFNAAGVFTNSVIVLYCVQSSVLVVKLVSDRSDLPTSYSRYGSAAGPQPPEGHFIILPSANCSLLIKSLAVSELMMPADFPAVEQQSQDCLENMSAVLDKVYELVYYCSLCVINHKS